MASTSESGELVGIGGWLATFIVIMAVISPVRVLVTTWANLYGDPSVAAAYAETWRAIEAYEWTLATVVVAISWFLVWRLVKVRAWKTVKLVIAGIWALAIGLQLAEFLGVALIGRVSVELVLPALFPGVLQPIVFCTIWTAYLLRSERVANTYPRHGDAEQVAGVFG